MRFQNWGECVRAVQIKYTSSEKKWWNWAKSVPLSLCVPNYGPSKASAHIFDGPQMEQGTKSVPIFRTEERISGDHLISNRG